MVDLHTNESLAHTRMAEDAERAARRRLRRQVLGGGRGRVARSLGAVAGRIDPSRRPHDEAHGLERAA